MHFQRLRLQKLLCSLAGKLSWSLLSRFMHTSKAETFCRWSNTAAHRSQALPELCCFLTCNFLKAPTSIAASCSDQNRPVALLWPQVSFKLFHGASANRTCHALSGHAQIIQQLNGLQAMIYRSASWASCCLSIQPEWAAVQWDQPYHHHQQLAAQAKSCKHICVAGANTPWPTARRLQPLSQSQYLVCSKHARLAAYKDLGAFLLCSHRLLTDCFTLSRSLFPHANTQLALYTTVYRALGARSSQIAWRWTSLLHTARGEGRPRPLATSLRTR